MLTDIFSTFDDQNQVFMSSYILLWLISLYIVFMLNFSLWVLPPSWKPLLFQLKEVIFNQLMRTFGIHSGGFVSLMVALFVFLIMLNLTGLIPYVFSPTSHMVLTLSLSVPLWLSFILSGIKTNFQKVIGSLLPMGAPAVLNPFLVLIETVSIFVRPLTLAIRLMANISAGHIVLSLVGNYLSAVILTANWSALILISIQIGYTIFEVGIGFIQAYIFCLLLTLYADEHPH